MRQRIVNVILGIVLIGLTVFTGFIFSYAGSLSNTTMTTAGEAVGSTIGIIFIISFFAIAAIIALVGLIVSLLNIKGSTSKSKMFSGTFAVGYLFILVLSVFKMLYL